MKLIALTRIGDENWKSRWLEFKDHQGEHKTAPSSNGSGSA